MNKLLPISFVLFFCSFFAWAGSPGANPGSYTLVVEGFDWGPSVSKVVLHDVESIRERGGADFEVFVTRSSKLGEIPAAQTSGKRSVVYVYPSDEKGNRKEDGAQLTLVLAVSPVDPLTSGIQYLRMGNQASNVWIDYGVTVIHGKTGATWNQEKSRVRPIVDQFDLTGTFTHQNTSLTYAAFTPKKLTGKAPLIIWLHGGGEGGTSDRKGYLGGTFSTHPHLIPKKKSVLCLNKYMCVLRFRLQILQTTTKKKQKNSTG